MVGFEAGALRFGPRARPLVMCCSSGAGPVFSSCADLVGDTSTSALDVDLFIARGGGPRASIPARAGLNRPASLPDIAGSFVVEAGAGCAGLSLMTGLFAAKLFLLIRASGMGSGSFGAAAFGSLSARFKTFFFAIASGVGGDGLDALSDLFSAEPTS